MNTFLTICFLVFSYNVAANSLHGVWTLCESEDKKHLEHFIEFMENGVEAEAHFLREQSKAPCQGSIYFGNARFWKFESNEKIFKSTLLTSHAIAKTSSMVKIFNSKSMCGTNKWKLNERIDCTDKNAYGFEGTRGFKSKHEYKIIGDKLHVTTEEGESLIYTRVAKPIRHGKFH